MDEYYILSQHFFRRIIFSLVENLILLQGNWNLNKYLSLRTALKVSNLDAKSSGRARN
jgi:hypothetical protein